MTKLISSFGLLLIIITSGCTQNVENNTNISEPQNNESTNTTETKVYSDSDFEMRFKQPDIAKESDIDKQVTEAIIKQDPSLLPDDLPDGIKKMLELEISESKNMKEEPAIEVEEVIKESSSPETVVPAEEKSETLTEFEQNEVNDPFKDLDQTTIDQIQKALDSNDESLLPENIDQDLKDIMISDIRNKQAYEDESAGKTNISAPEELETTGN